MDPVSLTVATWFLGVTGAVAGAGGWTAASFAAKDYGEQKLQLALARERDKRERRPQFEGTLDGELLQLRLLSDHTLPQIGVVLLDAIDGYTCPVGFKPGVHGVMPGGAKDRFGRSALRGLAFWPRYPGESEGLGVITPSPMTIGQRAQWPVGRMKGGQSLDKQIHLRVDCTSSAGEVWTVLVVIPMPHARASGDL